MFFKKVFLIFPDYKGYDMGALHPPVGLGYLAEVLLRSSIEYEVCDMRLGHNKDALIERIKDFKPDLIGISMMTLLYQSHYKLAKDIKRFFPDCFIVAGGPHISTLGQRALDDCPDIDFGITMEGEKALLELCNDKNFKDIEGFLYRDNGKIIYNENKNFLEDLNSASFPRFEKFELDKYISDEIAILTSRGCPHKCIYCPVQTVIGQRFRSRNAQTIADEIEYWFRKGYRKIGIADDNFTLIKDRVYEICDELEKRKISGIEFKCGNGIRVDKVDKKLLTRMRQVGFKHIAFGVEAGNDKILKVLKKGESIGLIKKTITDACNLDYEVTLFFLVGSPYETEEDIYDSIEIAKKNPIFDVRFYNIIPFPKTELFDWLSSKGYFLKKPEDYLNNSSHFDDQPVFFTPELGANKRKKMLKLLRSVRREVRYRAMSNKLKRLGLLSPILAAIYVTGFVQGVILKRKFFRRKLRSIYDMITKSSSVN